MNYSTIRLNVVNPSSISVYEEGIANRGHIFDQARPLVSHLEFNLLEKPITPNNIGEALKGPQRQFWKYALFVQY